MAESSDVSGLHRSYELPDHVSEDRRSTGKNRNRVLCDRGTLVAYLAYLNRLESRENG